MVVTTESLLNDKKNIAADSYEKVLLPKVRSTTIRVSATIAKGDVLQRAAQCTEVHYRKLPKHLDWKECLVNIRSAPLTLPDLRTAADGTNDLGVLEHVPESVYASEHQGRHAGAALIVE